MRVSATISTLSLALLAGACALPDTDSFRAPDSSALFRRFSVTSTLNEKPLPPVTAADMVDASGNCAAAYVPTGAGDQPSGTSLREAGVPPVPAAIALDMTECDVVRRAGTADKVDIGAQGIERTVTLTYLRGERPGIYRFAEGRLKSMELAPEQPSASRTAKPAKKPPARRASQNQVSVQ